MHAKGFAFLPNLLTTEQCEALKAGYGNPGLYRKTVVMERCRFGLGEYKYFNFPLPGFIQNIRTGVYPKLACIANAWFRAMNIGKIFPATHTGLLQQ